MGGDDAARIINEETQEQLIKVRNEELSCVRKLRLILNTIKAINVSDIDLPDRTQIEKAIKLIKVAEYLYLNNSKDLCILNLGDTCTVNLSYTERKALRGKIIDDLHKTLGPILQYKNEMIAKSPELFSSENYMLNRVIALEERRSANLQKILELRTRKINLLKTVVELKIGAYLGYELEIMLGQARQTQTKVNLLRGYLTNEMLTRSEHSLKALQEVESYIDKLLEAEEEKKKKSSK